MHEPFNRVRHVGICPCKCVQSAVDALGTLLSHHSQTNSPLPNEWRHVILQHMEFRSDTGFREGRLVVCEEFI